MECLPLHIAHIGIVEIIADQRIPDVFHMYADLVCATGFQLQMIDIFMKDDKLLGEMCDSIRLNKSVGLYDGAYKVVEIAMGLKEKNK